MCGHVGIAGEISLKEDKIIKTLLVLDSLRGEDSTGVAFVEKSGDVTVTKELGSPYELFESKRFIQSMKYQTRAMIGHNRFATSGGISKSSAHPFEFDTLVGAHNGTLKNKWKLLDANDFKVDSENLFHHIEQKGLKDAIDTCDGAWALVWWDKVKETLNFLRNKERTLFMVTSLDNKTLFWASESWMLTVACNRHDVLIGDIVPVTADIHYSFHISEKGGLNKPHIKEMKSAYEAPVFHQNNGQWDAHKKQHWANGKWNDGGMPPTDNNLLQTAKNIVNDKSKDTVEKKVLTLPVIPTGIINTYVGSKQKKLEVVSSSIDTNGARFVKLMDGEHPSLPIRLYLRRKDPLQHMVGREIKGDISGYSNVKGDGPYFKVNPHTVEILPEADNASFLYDDGHGRKLSKKEWEEKYPNCEYCFDHLYAEDHGNRLTSTGGCLCGACVDKEEVVEGLNLTKVY